MHLSLTRTSCSVRQMPYVFQSLNYSVPITPGQEPQIWRMWFVLCSVCWQSWCLAWKQKRDVWFSRRTARNTSLEFSSSVLPSKSRAWTPLHAVWEPILIHDVVRQVIHDNFNEPLRAKWHVRQPSWCMQAGKFECYEHLNIVYTLLGFRVCTNESNTIYMCSVSPVINEITRISYVTVTWNYWYPTSS